ncbi:hypothetical protein EJ03DRAFT_143434 [Teratosphaeria nubilosa]|uniref:Uncharacterized protein n=1 Tax=Teratosphaeria nubilosa TaxID=161662 RepID=A0A6G1L4M7_9PEZI|nr:hypothetical protein EJ03DRAFT_143434 [Teratosphaeria nubilosa]
MHPWTRPLSLEWLPVTWEKRPAARPVKHAELSESNKVLPFPISPYIIDFPGAVHPAQIPPSSQIALRDVHFESTNAFPTYPEPLTDTIPAKYVQTGQHNWIVESMIAYQTFISWVYLLIAERRAGRESRELGSVDGAWCSCVWRDKSGLNALLRHVVCDTAVHWTGQQLVCVRDVCRLLSDAGCCGRVECRHCRADISMSS